MKSKMKKWLVASMFFGLVLEAWASGLVPEQVTRFSVADRIAPMTGVSAAAAADEPGYPWRGILIGADHGSENIHHDNIYVQIDGGPVIYQTTIPARKEGNLLPDEGLLWHFYTRDDTEITVYATSALVSGLESVLSDPFPIYFSYPQPEDCTSQTVPVSDAGQDQLVNIGTLVELDASASFDAYELDNENLVYIWECYSAPVSEVILSQDGRAARVTFTPDTPGNYYFRVSVRDQVDGSTFNRSPISYVRVSAVADLGTQPYLVANAGRTRQAFVGDAVILDGSASQGSEPITSYSWSLENPLGTADIQNLASHLGMTACQGGCYLSNYNADAVVDGEDLALLAANYAGPDLPEGAVVEFVAGIARPHIFKLTVSDGGSQDSETTIVAVSHENAQLVLTPPPVDPACNF